MFPSFLVLGVLAAIPLLRSRRRAGVVAVAALLVASCAAWGVVTSRPADADGTGFVGGFVLAAANGLVGLAVGLLVFGATQPMSAGAAPFSRRRGGRAPRRPPTGRAS